MQRIAVWAFGIVLTSQVLANNIPGDINLGLDASPNNHAYKFRLIVNGSSITYSTACVAPNTGLAQALSNGAIGMTSARLTVQASDCALYPDSWGSLSGYVNYDSRYWYNVYVNMNTRAVRTE